MAIHPDFPKSPHSILSPDICWFPADEVLRESSYDELVVLNDEAHHIHDSRMAWFKSIEEIHNRLKQKDRFLSLQVDVTATPRHNNGAIFVQTISDYLLVEAITQNVVKHPVVPDSASRENSPGGKALFPRKGMQTTSTCESSSGAKHTLNIKNGKESDSVCHNRRHKELR